MLPGLTIGDCGAKVGYVGMDNGFVFFKDFRVPKDALLDKLCSIEQDGTYNSPIESKNKRFAATVSALSSGRVIFGYTSARLHISFLALPIKYSHLMRQFKNSPDENVKENVLIDY